MPAPLVPAPFSAILFGTQGLAALIRSGLNNRELGRTQLLQAQAQIGLLFPQSPNLNNSDSYADVSRRIQSYDYATGNYWTPGTAPTDNMNNMSAELKSELDAYIGKWSADAAVTFASAAELQIFNKCRQY